MSNILIVGGAFYFAGALFTAGYNLHDMVYISRPLVIVRNAIFWPVFLPVLIALRNG